MPHHVWNDGWEYWKDLGDAIHFCKKHWRAWGRIGIAFSKEKWGVFNHNCQFYWGSWPIHELVKPGYTYYQWPKWLMLIEMEYLSKAVKYIGMRWLVQQWQKLVYNVVLWRALRKWSHIRDELLCDADYDMLWNGKEIQQQYWETK